MSAPQHISLGVTLDQGMTRIEPRFPQTPFPAIS